MAYAPHHRFVFGGKLSYTGETPEIWECAINGVGRNGTADSAFSFDEYLSQVAPAMAAWMRNASQCVNLASLDYLKINLIGPDGRYVDRTVTHRHDYSAPEVGSTGPVNPQIISTAVSWATALGRGPGSKGRIYLPNNGGNGATSMIVDGPMGDAILTSGLSLLTVLNNSSDGGYSWLTGIPRGTHIFIPTVSSKVNATNTTIQGVRVGSVKDVQRRRKSALKETYVFGPFLPVTS